MWDEISNYVREIVETAYPEEKDMLEDSYIKEYFYQCSNANLGGYIDFPVMPSNKAHLADILSRIIW